jgi:RimJ/RimL family protein N-acetyltransferase
MNNKSENSKLEFIMRGGKVSLRDKSSEDAFRDYTWRIDLELARLDATYPPTTSFGEFETYYLDELEHPSRDSRRFGIETHEGVHIGNCMYYDLNPYKSEAELGILVGDKEYWNGGFGTEAVTLLLDYLFREIGLKRVYLKTLDWNIRAQKSFQKCGFVEYRRNSRGAWDFILMEIFVEGWEKQSEGNRALKEYPRSAFPQA